MVERRVVLNRLENEKVDFVRFFFADVRGGLCDFTVPVEEFESSIEGGKGFDGSSIEGMARIAESDLLAKPDLDTLVILPWEYQMETMDQNWREAVFFADIMKPDGEPYEGDSRYILKKMIQNLGGVGATTFNVGPEPEFFLFGANGKGEPIVKDGKPLLMDSGGYFQGGANGEIRKEVMLLLKEMGVITEYDHHEVAPSQHEVDLKYLDALKMADTLFLFKYVTKRVARKKGFFASFMPKPIMGINGSGMHIHQSLFNGDSNLFYDGGRENNLSEVALHYLGGLMKHVPEMSLVLNPNVNSYKRLQPGFEAPCYVTWALKNRSDLIRVPGYESNEQAMRFELRSPDPSCNTYLAFALMLKAGMKGIQERIRPPYAVEENVYSLDEEERDVRGIRSLPTTLDEAIKIAQGSEFVQEVLGDHLFGKVLENAKRQSRDYQRAKPLLMGNHMGKITPYELEHLLPVL